MGRGNGNGGGGGGAVGEGPLWQNYEYRGNVHAPVQGPLRGRAAEMMAESEWEDEDDERGEQSSVGRRGSSF